MNPNLPLVAGAVFYAVMLYNFFVGPVLPGNVVGWFAAGLAMINFSWIVERQQEDSE